MRPSSSQTTRSQKRRISFMLWVTSTTDPEAERTSSMRSAASRRNSSSPTVSASSISRISGMRAVAMAKRSRARMPEEYVRIGRSMSARSPAKSMISSIRRSTSARVNPNARPPIRMLRRPESAGRSTDDTPSSDGRDRPRMVPERSGSSPVIAASSVDLPAPFGPISPSVSRSNRSSVTPCTAGIMRYWRRIRPRAKPCLRPMAGSSNTR